MKKSTSDHEADRDALRARRAADQRERDFRAKEKAEAEKQVKRQVLFGCFADLFCQNCCYPILAVY